MTVYNQRGFARAVHGAAGHHFAYGLIAVALITLDI